MQGRNWNFEVNRNHIKLKKQRWWPTPADILVGM